MFLNDKEGKIIATFYSNLAFYENIDMQLKWSDDFQINASFDTCFESDNDLEMSDPHYEEFTVFVFKVNSVIGSSSVYITEDNYFCIDYRNFPKEIIANGKKIN